ncbi:MAG: hypothetical protein ACI81R_002014 [Bradymonadia bacterium]|jgi:hypothetical protein
MLPDIAPFDTVVLADLAHAFDDQLLFVARVASNRILDVFDDDAETIYALPRQPLHSRRRHGVALMCRRPSFSAMGWRIYHTEFQSRADRTEGAKGDRLPD